MKFPLACLGACAAGVFSVSAAAQSWSYRPNPALDVETRCISPSGDFVGGWRSCRADRTCNNAAAISNQCKLMFGTPSAGFGSGDLTVIKVKLDQVMQPKSVTDAAVDCARNLVCKAVLDAAAAYVGVDSRGITGAMALITEYRLGEEGDFHYVLPLGYQYCRVKIETVSVVPATGDSASLMSITGADRELRVQTWTPILGLGQGRSWVEADFTIIGVRDSLAQQYRSKGVCKDRYIRTVCRGATGINNGSPACGVIAD